MRTKDRGTNVCRGVPEVELGGPEISFFMCVGCAPVGGITMARELSGRCLGTPQTPERGGKKGKKVNQWGMKEDHADG